MRIVVDGLAYPIVVSTDGPIEATRLLAPIQGRVFIIADSAVLDRAQRIRTDLELGGYEISGELSVRAGERFKRWASVAELHDRLAATSMDRDGIIVAVGGGSLTDVAGFAAATYLRGVRWLPVATTVTGMVDAAIGGKTGVNTLRGKNVIGAFWQPVGVVADVAALPTLGRSAFRDGLAEMVKAAVIADPKLLERLRSVDRSGEPAAWAPLIASAAGVKARIAASDPLDRGVRAALNLGHTFAHAFERASSYRVSHGAAVALGLRACGILAREHTGWSREDHRLVLETLSRFGLRLAAPRLEPSAVIDAMKVDKKRKRGTNRFVLPVRLGEVKINVEVADDEVLSVLAELRTAPGRRGW